MTLISPLVHDAAVHDLDRARRDRVCLTSMAIGGLFLKRIVSVRY